MRKYFPVILASLLAFGIAEGTSWFRVPNLVVSGPALIGIASQPNSKAVLDLESTTKGFLMPVMTATQRNAISLPPAGLQVFNSTTGHLNFYDGSTWQDPSSGGSSVTNNYSQAYTTGAASWSTTSASYTDPVVSGTPAITVRRSNGITLTQMAGGYPGITFTPASSSSVYLITAVIGVYISSPTSNFAVDSQLYDGSTVISQGIGVTPGNDAGVFANGNVHAVPITGVYAPGTGSPVSVRVQLAASGATANLANWALGNAIEWTVIQIL